LQGTLNSKIARIAFLILLFFTIWGTSLPFKERLDDMSALSSTNVINQVLYSLLFLLSVITLISRKTELLNIIKQEKFLSLFITFAFLSIIWSDYSIITFKRIFRILAVNLTIISFLLHIDSARDVLKYFKYILYPYLVLTIIVVLVIPGALDPQFLTWRGFTSHKNTLGQIALISIFLCYIIYKVENSSSDRIVAALMLFLSILILFGAFSSTSIITFVFFVGMALLFSVDVFFKTLGIGRTISFIIVLSFISIIITIAIWFPEMANVIPGLFGKDTTFSGRTDLWDYLISEFPSHPILGTGYQAFWVTESKKVMVLFELFFWLPNQAHNGFIDLLIQTGIIGLSLSILTFISYFVSYYKIAKPHPWIIIILITIVTNFQESTLLRPGQTLNFLFMFSYLLLFVNFYKNFVWKRNLEIEEAL